MRHKTGPAQQLKIGKRSQPGRVYQRSATPSVPENAGLAPELKKNLPSHSKCLSSAAAVPPKQCVAVGKADCSLRYKKLHAPTIYKDS
ncbi:MAG: hypothetical protein VXX91_02495 [Planctomycetota bacterium]|nr:hypothetical protein [Planctomycetota bacterium]